MASLFNGWGWEKVRDQLVCGNLPLGLPLMRCIDLLMCEAHDIYFWGGAAWASLSAWRRHLGKFERLAAPSGQVQAPVWASSGPPPFGPAPQGHCRHPCHAPAPAAGLQGA